MLSIPLALALMQTTAPGLTLPQAERFAELALACVYTEYPNKISHTLASDADARPPHALTPVFYGCFDWHSSVHGHWLLACVARLYPDTPIAARAIAALSRSFTREHIDGELAYLRVPHRQEFERPYGLAWLLQLTSELREWNSPQAQPFLGLLTPLEQEAARRLVDWSTTTTIRRRCVRCWAPSLATHSWSPASTC